MPQHLPHVVPQIARSKTEEQLLQSLSPERLQSSSRTHSAIRHWTCCPPAKATAWGCVPDEVSRGFEVKGRQVTSITANSLFIHGTDILERPWHRKHKKNHTKTQDQTFTLTEWELWSSRHKQGRRTGSTIATGTSSVQVFTKFVTMWMPVGALSHFLVLKMCSRRSSFKRVTF